MTQHTTSDFLQAHKQAETFSRYIEVLILRQRNTADR